MVDTLIGFACLLLLSASSIALGNRMGQTRPALVLASGFLATTAGLVALNLLLNLLGSSFAYYPLSFALVVAAIVFTSKSWFADRKALLPARLMALGAATVSFLLIGVLHFRGAPSYDSTFVLSLSHLIQSGEPFSLASDYFKRGLAYPILHSFSQLGHFAPMITVFMAILVGLLAIELIGTVLAKLNGAISRRAGLVAYAVTALIVFTSPMVWNAALYIREHTLVALAVGLLFTLLVNLSTQPAQKIDRPDFLAWMAASIVVAASRPEGVAIALIFTLAIYGRLSRTQRIALVTSPIAVVLIWLQNLHYSALPKLVIDQPWLVLPILLVVAAVAFIQFGQEFLSLVPALLLGLLAAIFVAELSLFYGSLAKGIQSQFVNLVLQKGGWGLLMVAALLALVAALVWRGFAIERLALFTLASLLLLFLIAKTLDLGILEGRPDLGRVGISDSLNRMWLHLLLPLSVVLYFGIAGVFQKLLVPKTKGVKS
mgnify:CR=1 FL=1